VRRHTPSASTFQIFDDLHEELDADPMMEQMWEEALAGKWSNKWKEVDNLLMIMCCVYVPVSSTQVQALLEAAHDIRHEGTENTLLRPQATFHIPGVRTTVQDFM
jgi:CO dehydrogenase/acetyl-CoA synthase gamma subunit (corrinoid Fe-S protein)